MSSAVISDPKLYDDKPHGSDAHDDHAHDESSTTVFGFWIYIMSDCVLFAILFATYVVLSTNTFGGPSAAELFDMNYVLLETFLLLTSSFTYGIAMLGMYKGNRQQVLVWLVITFCLGAGFIGMELNEFHMLVQEGHSWQTSAFLSAFFTLVATHGLHVSLGMLWMAVMIFIVMGSGLQLKTRTRLMCLGLFWHFLDIIWICVFTVVYLLGAA